MITISSGHWTVGTGASGFIDEVTEARKVTNRIIEILRSSKITVNHVEDNVSKNKNENLTYLITQHNKTTRKLDVSIHFNATVGTLDRPIGVEVLYYSEKDLADKLSKAISNASGLINRGAKERKELSFLAKTTNPAVLLEICFVNSSVDVALYKQHFEKICQSIASELMKHIGVSPISTNVENGLQLLNKTGREETRQLLKMARNSKIIGTVHTDEKIDKYSDIELLSYQAAVINRTFNK